VKLFFEKIEAIDYYYNSINKKSHFPDSRVFGITMSMLIQFLFLRII